MRGITMKKLELSIFKKFAWSIIGIIIIPIILLITNEVYNSAEKELFEKKEERTRNLNTVYNKLVDTYSLLEAIQLIVASDLDFLEFLVSQKEHSPVDYVNFQRENVKDYQKLLLISKEITIFKIYVDNKKLYEIYPYVYNKLPKYSSLTNQTRLIIRQGKPYLYYFKEIYFYPQKVYLEIEVDLSKIFNENLQNYYLIDNERVINTNNEEEKNLSDILKKVNFDKVEKIEIIRNPEEMYIFQNLPFTDVKLLTIVYQKSLVDKKYLAYLIFIGIFTLAVIYLISYIISKKIFKQLDYIFDAVHKIKEGNLKIDFSVKFDNREFSELSEQLIHMANEIERLIKENVETQNLIYDFQMKALQSQINSHFLLNTLEGIKMMAYIKGDYEVSDSLLNLGKILKYGIDWKNPEVRIEDEVEYLKRYVNLFSIRTEEEIILRTYMDKELKNTIIPKMILQPLVENAIIHGIIPKGVKGYIQLRIYKKDRNLFFEILDNGMGIKNKLLEKSQGGIGVINVQKRFELFFNGKVSFNIFSQENIFTRIQIIVEGCENYEKNTNS
jgi:two-component system, sensor histidine kinase YesM